MNITIRVDSSSQIGTGHVVRCLTLAEELRQAGCNVSFLSQNLTGDSQDAIKARCFTVSHVPAPNRGSPDRVLEGNIADTRLLGADWKYDAESVIKALTATQTPMDWLIVDHYALDARWERLMRPFAKHIMVIDDLANRPHDCDILLDQTYGTCDSRYERLVPPHCHRLLGTKFTLLRPQFARRRAHLVPAMSLHPRPSKVHVFFGGTDPHRNSLRFSSLLLENFPTLSIKLAVSTASEIRGELEKLGDRHEPRLRWSDGITDMAENMSGCDIAIGAPGMATWERACLGIPGAYIATAENQVQILEQLAAQRFCAFIGIHHAITDDQFVRAIGAFVADVGLLSTMRHMNMAAVDGLGTSRVVNSMLEIGQR